jgi:hypothetical protein
MNRVHSLRKAGNKVSVTHRRRYFDPVNRRWSMLSRYERSLAPLPEFVSADVRGGETEVTLRTKDGRELRSVAKCSKKDAYVRSVGLNFALDGLLFEVTKPVECFVINNPGVFPQTTFDGFSTRGEGVDKVVTHDLVHRV